MQCAHVAALHAAAFCDRTPESHPPSPALDDFQLPHVPPVYAERVFVLHAATSADLAAAVTELWTPGRTGSTESPAPKASWFVEPDRFFELTAVAFDDPDHFPTLASGPLWSPPALDPGPFECRSEVRSLLAAADRLGVDAVDVWETAARLGDPASLAARRSALWLCTRGKEPPMS